MSERRRVTLVTGSTDGIGRQTALALGRAGHHVIVHGRSRPRVESTLVALAAEAPGATFEGVSFDLGSLASVRRGAAELAERFAVLDVLLNNAGVFATERVVTEDGLELTLAVNHVGPFLLTELLLPLLRRAEGARVINVSSIAHTRGQLLLDDLPMARGYSGYGAYARSKLANVMHALSLAERHPAMELAAYSLHPGVISTKLLREGFGPVRGASTTDGARTSVRLATAAATDAGDGVAINAPSGTYFSDGVPAPPAVAARDRAARDALWAASVQLAGLGPG